MGNFLFDKLQASSKVTLKSIQQENSFNPVF